MVFCRENTSTDVDVYIRFLHLPWNYFISRHLWRHASNLMIFLTVNLLGNLQDDTDSTTWSSVQLSDVFTSCVEKYETHREETRSGTHGTTAQSWIMYVDYIHDFHNLVCAIRTNDINLFLHALTPTCSLQPTTSTIQDGCQNSNLICSTLIVLTLACVTS